MRGDFAMDNTHKIIQVKDHYEAYNSRGEFVTSGDTYKECEEELIEMIVEEEKKKREKVSA